jgi:predicted tellurium resistance membrane protein TerC
VGIRLLLYIGVILLGAFISYKGKISEKILDKLNIIQTLCLLFLLFIMGIKIGIDEKVISSFFNIGFKAIIMSIFTVGFSILFVFIVSKLFIRKENKIES